MSHVPGYAPTTSYPQKNINLIDVIGRQKARFGLMGFGRGGYDSDEVGVTGAEAGVQRCAGL